jgi:hypothetical protein
MYLSSQRASFAFSLHHENLRKMREAIAKSLFEDALLLAKHASKFDPAIDR